MIFESPVPLATRDTFPTTPRRAKELLHLSVKGVDGRYAESQVRVEWDGMGWGEMALDVTTRYNGQTVVLQTIGIETVWCRLCFSVHFGYWRIVSTSSGIIT